MTIYQRNGLWHWCKMVDGVTLSRSTKTEDKALATKIARKWDHEAVQQIKVDGERPVLPCPRTWARRQRNTSRAWKTLIRQ